MICHEFPAYKLEDLEQLEDIAPVMKSFIAWMIYRVLSTEEGRKSRLMGDIAQYGLETGGG